MNTENNNTLSVQGILPFLSNELPQIQSGNFSERIFIFDSLESTNNTAKEWAASGTGEHGTIVIADFQSAGKGRCGKSFYSPAGHGLYISLIIDPLQIGFSTPTLITAFAAVIVCEAIEAISGKSPVIKWVNDVFLDSRKICGILTESVTPLENTSFEGIATQFIVLGIGINFSTPIEEFPENLKRTAGSLFGTGTPTTTRNHLAAELINRLLLSQYHQSEKKMLMKYKQKMFLLGKTVLVEGAGGSYEATAVDVDEIGRLVVKKANGELQPLSSGEVSICPSGHWVLSASQVIT